MLFRLYFLSTSIIQITVLTGKIESNGFGAELFRGYIDFSVSKKYGNIQEKSILVRELDCKIYATSFLCSYMIYRDYK